MLCISLKAHCIKSLKSILSNLFAEKCTFTDQNRKDPKNRKILNPMENSFDTKLCPNKVCCMSQTSYYVFSPNWYVVQASTLYYFRVDYFDSELHFKDFPCRFIGNYQNIWLWCQLKACCLATCSRKPKTPDSSPTASYAQRKFSAAIVSLMPNCLWTWS